MLRTCASLFSILCILTLVGACGDDAGEPGSGSGASSTPDRTSSTPIPRPGPDTTVSEWSTQPSFPSVTTSGSSSTSSSGGTEGTPTDPFAHPEVDISGDAPAPGTLSLPKIPRALTAYPGDREIRVRWWEVEGAEAYALYRATRRGGTPERASRVELTRNGFVDRDAPPGEERFYAVAAILDGIEGPISGEVRGVSVEAVPPRELHVTMEPETLELLYTRSRSSSVPLPANLRVMPESRVVSTEGIRFRGAGSRRYPKMGFNLRLTDRPDFFNFASNQRGGGDRILLNAMWTDATALRETISYRMYRDLNMPAPSVWYTDLYLNDLYEGFYIAFERIDREALRGWGLNRTRGGMTLVRDEMKSGRNRYPFFDDETRTAFMIEWEEIFGSREEQLAFMPNVFDWRGEEEDQDWEGLLDMLIWVRDTPPGAEFVQGFEERFRADEIIDFIAIHSLSQDTDSFDTDYWLYRDEQGDNRWRWIPWDKNLTFGGLWTGDFLGGNNFMRYDFRIVSPRANQVVKRVLDTPELYARFEARLRELLEDVYTPEWMQARIDEYLPLVARSMDRHPGENAFFTHPRQHAMDTGYLPHQLEQLTEFLDLRRRWLYFEMDRRAGIRHGEADRGRMEDIIVAGGTRQCAADRAGRTIGCITPSRTWAGTFDIHAVEDTSVDGVQRRYELRLSRPFEGTVTFFYQNATGRNWLELNPDDFDGRGNPERYWAGDQWRLETVITDAEGGVHRPRSFVNPMVNRMQAEVDLDGGVYTAVLVFGP